MSRQHEADLDELAALRAAISMEAITAKLVALAQAHRQDSEDVDVFEATKDTALAQLDALRTDLEGLEQEIRELCARGEDAHKLTVLDWLNRIAAMRTPEAKP